METARSLLDLWQHYILSITYTWIYDVSGRKKTQYRSNFNPLAFTCSQLNDKEPTLVTEMCELFFNCNFAIQTTWSNEMKKNDTKWLKIWVHNLFDILSSANYNIHTKAWCHYDRIRVSRHRIDFHSNIDRCHFRWKTDKSTLRNLISIKYDKTAYAINFIWHMYRSWSSPEKEISVINFTIDFKKKFRGKEHFSKLSFFLKWYPVNSSKLTLDQYIVYHNPLYRKRTSFRFGAFDFDA